MSDSVSLTGAGSMCPQTLKPIHYSSSQRQALGQGNIDTHLCNTPALVDGQAFAKAVHQASLFSSLYSSRANCCGPAANKA